MAIQNKKRRGSVPCAGNPAAMQPRSPAAPARAREVNKLIALEGYDCWKVSGLDPGVTAGWGGVAFVPRLSLVFCSVSRSELAPHSWFLCVLINFVLFNWFHFSIYQSHLLPYIFIIKNIIRLLISIQWVNGTCLNYVQLVTLDYFKQTREQ